jgi:hypothetical protein
MNRYLCVWLLLLQPLLPAPAFAEILFESGTLGPTGIYINEIGGGVDPAGAVVSDFVFDGVRFEIMKAAITTRIGGHFVADPRHNDSFFGTIVRLDNAMDFPDSGDLSTPDVLGTTLLTFPNPSAEAFGDLEIHLDPGWYALLFGSGLFGASGSGAMPLNNSDIGSPMYIGFQPWAGVGWGNLDPVFNDYRFVVEGLFVPEPSASVLIAMLASSTFAIQFRLRR